MTKGELMERLFTKEELIKIDTAIDIANLKSRSGEIRNEEAHWYVTNYNESALGSLVDMRVLAKSKGINLEAIYGHAV